ncbi:MAG: hypothetical protein ACI87H_001252 [Gammaproteobacteria bacterium]|jgi:hypothetical protein
MTAKYERVSGDCCCGVVRYEADGGPQYAPLAI